MSFNTILALIFCIFVQNLYGLEKCHGPSTDSQDDFKIKYETAPIVAYGTVISATNNIVSLKISCTLKGQINLPVLELSQLTDVPNVTECHYLTKDKNYLVFLESMQTSGTDGKRIYRLADMEEIEINTHTMANFMNEECADEDDYGIDMTMFYIDNTNLKCGQFVATCNQMTKTAISALTYSPLSKSTQFLGGYKKVLAVPKSDSKHEEKIASKQGTGISDEHNRNSATIASISMGIVLFLASLVMFHN